MLIVKKSLKVIFHGRNFFSLYCNYNKKPLHMAGACDTYFTVYIYLRNTLSLVNMQSVNIVQNTISKPRLFMIFYWQKFFYLKNIQRSFLVRCRLGKLAFFITTHRSLRSLTKTPKSLLGTGISQFIYCSNYLAIAPQFAAQTVYKFCVISCS